MEGLIEKIINEAILLKNKHTDQINIPVNYVCVFCQSEEELNDFLKQAHKLGSVIKETPTGSLFKISLNTIVGKLQLLKIRKPDSTRPERGDADFTVSDYWSFKEKYLNDSGFSLIKRKNFEMMELYKENYDVRVYFSFPPLDKQFNLV